MTDWDLIRTWDDEHYAHVFVTADEYEHVAVARTDGDFIELSDGTRLLDFTSGLLCTNAGHRNPRIRNAIVEALDRYGFVSEGFATDLRARAAKLICDDLLGPDDWVGRSASPPRARRRSSSPSSWRSSSPAAPTSSRATSPTTGGPTARSP